MDKTNDHHDNPKLILRGWKDSKTDKFYLIYADPKSNELKIVPTNEGNRIFRTKGFHPTVVDSQIIQPFETAFSKLLPNLNHLKLNHIVRIHNDIGIIVNFCVRQLVRGQNFKSATKQLHDEFGEAEWKTAINRYKLTSRNDILEYYTVKGRYLKLLKYENVLPLKSAEYVNRLNSMNCWGILVNPNVGDFVTGAQPYFFKIEGGEYENLECMKRAYFVITPNFSITFCDDQFGFGNEDLISFDNKKAREIILLHNTEILKRSYYIISKRLPFIGYELDPKLKLRIDSYLKNREI